mmetsp:Transcript_13922/g.58577  ORF Transcript_13922/g.58577 Transcript_13922/m.58577 type:complete len:239 (+) Transcript_13922:483-1199(+)
MSHADAASIAANAACCSGCVLIAPFFSSAAAPPASHPPVASRPTAMTLDPTGSTRSTALRTHGSASISVDAFASSFAPAAFLCSFSFLSPTPRRDASRIARDIHRRISATASGAGSSTSTSRCLLGFCHTMGHTRVHSSHCSLVRGARPGTCARSGVSACRSTTADAAAGQLAAAAAESPTGHSTTLSDSGDASAAATRRTRLTCGIFVRGNAAETSFSTWLHRRLSTSATHTSTRTS